MHNYPIQFCVGGMMYQKFASLILVASVLVVGCAKKAESIAVTPISADKAAKVASLNCNQIMQAMAFTDAKLSRASGVQNAKASDDKLMVAGGVALFLPLLFFTEGNKGAANISELKGVMEALEGEAIRKNCKRPTAGLL